jgi:hypothetical protein
MSIFTTVIVKRATMQLYTHIAVQIDNISAVTIAAMGGAIPVNSSNLISQQGVPDIVQGDYLIDEGKSAENLDVKTGSGKAEYRVSGTPEIYPYDHLEVLIERYKQVGP